MERMVGELGRTRYGKSIQESAGFFVLVGAAALKCLFWEPGIQSYNLRMGDKRPITRPTKGYQNAGIF